MPPRKTLRKLAVTRRAPSPQQTLKITATGAVGDGKTLNTIAIQDAIDRLVATGGLLVIPRGVFRTGALYLKPGVNLHISGGGVLQGSVDVADYPRIDTRIEGHTEPWCPAIINAIGCDHLRITGRGMIRGGGKPFWDAFWNTYNADNSTKNLDVYRPRNMLIQDSRDVHISGLRLRDSGFWNLHLFRCRDVAVENLDIRAPYPSPSTDGIDVDSSQDVRITRCHISVNDDCVAIKGNKGPLADKIADIPAVKHVRISHCTFGFGHGVVTLGSEACHVSDVIVENCSVKHSATAPETSVIVRLKLRPDTPQYYHDIHWRNIKVQGRCELVAAKAWTQYFDLKGLPAPTQRVENLTITNVTGTLADFGEITGPENARVSNVRIENVNVRYLDRKARPTVTLRAAKLKIKNVKINGRAIELAK
jgi:alpha-L-rhamnosidase